MGLNQTSYQPGQLNANAHMTNAEARAARFLRAEWKVSMDLLSTMYGVSRSSISYMLRGVTYKDAGGPIEPGRSSPGTSLKYKRRMAHKSLGSGTQEEERS
jgi:hypothetical protein